MPEFEGTLVHYSQAIYCLSFTLVFRVLTLCVCVCVCELMLGVQQHVMYIPLLHTIYTRACRMLLATLATLKCSFADIFACLL